MWRHFFTLALHVDLTLSVNAHGELGLHLGLKTNLNKLMRFSVKIPIYGHEYFPAQGGRTRLGRLENRVEDHGQTIRTRELEKVLQSPVSF